MRLPLASPPALVRRSSLMSNEELSDVRDETGHLVRELHGVTLASVLEYLVDRYGWPELARRIRINCFAVDPSVKSSLTFLRRTPWARSKVEALFVRARTSELLGRPLP